MQEWDKTDAPLVVFSWMRVFFCFVKNTSLSYTIIESCKMNEFRPVKYIADVLRKLISADMGYVTLLPMNIVKQLNY